MRKEKLRVLMDKLKFNDYFLIGLAVACATASELAALRGLLFVAGVLIGAFMFRLGYYWEGMSESRPELPPEVLNDIERVTSMYLLSSSREPLSDPQDYNSSMFRLHKWVWSLQGNQGEEVADEGQNNT
jgi:hypothetical protein